MNKLIVPILLLTLFANQQQKSTVEKSAQQAREVVEAGIKAMGGLAELQKINDITPAGFDAIRRVCY